MHKLILIVATFMALTSCKNDTSNPSGEIGDQDVKDITLEEAIKLMTQPDIITIDIRTPEEIDKGKILDSALEMDYYADDYNDKLSKLDKGAKYVMYCRSGGRSGKTLKTMKKMGFKNAYNVLGGYNEYKEKYGDNPVEE